MADIVWPGWLGKESPAGGVRNKLDEQMTQLSEIYNQRILELSANIPQAERLADADATRYRALQAVRVDGDG